MSNKLYFFINILVFWVAVTAVTAILVPANGRIFSLIAGGAILGTTALIVEPLIKFFKFPVNLWSIILFSGVINFGFFYFLSLGFLPEILIIKTGSFGVELAPVTVTPIKLVDKTSTVALITGIVTLLQLLGRKLVNS